MYVFLKFFTATGLNIEMILEKQLQYYLRGISDRNTILLADPWLEQMFRWVAGMQDEALGAPYLEGALQDPFPWDPLDVRIFPFSLTEGKSCCKVQAPEFF